MKPVIFFDFDYTLYNAEVFIEGKITSYAQKFGLDRNFVTEKENEAAEEVMSHWGKFIHEEYAKTVAQFLGIPDQWQEVYSVVFDENLHKNALYPEVEQVLDSLKKDFRLGIFSQGDYKLQRLKFEKAGLEGYFEPDLVFLLDDKIPEIPMVVQKYNAFAALDDKVEVVEAWAKAGVPLVIRVRRGRFAEGNLQGERPNIHEVKNLSEAYEIIINLKDFDT